MEMIRTMLEPDPRNVKRARRFVEKALHNSAMEDLSELVILLTGELVTNAFTHAASRVGLSLQTSVDCVRVEVADWGDGEPKVTPTDLMSTSGRGLGLVDTLANDWGVRHDVGSKSVWFLLCH